MQIDLTGKRALVCGASQGIGRAVAVELAALGASVTVFGRNEKSLQQVVESLARGAKQTHHVLVADFARPDEVRQKALEHIAEVGPITILVNNTGGPPPG